MTDCSRCKRRDRRRAARHVETTDATAGLRRSIAALGRRVAAGDPEDLTQLLALREAIDAAMTIGVAGLRAQGHSDNELARATGLRSRQAARARWPRQVPTSTVASHKAWPEPDER